MNDNNDWLDESDLVYGENGGNLSESQELRKLKRIHWKRGYRDGVSSAKEEALQQGFDEKFPDGCKSGFQVGEIIGRMQVLNSLFGDEDEDLRQDFHLALRELRISNVLTRSNFDNEMNILGSKPAVISKWDSILVKYSEKYCV
ncbi:Yae1p Ecym_3151 [Eremothecium cymbalariae DBVPG|uniref:Protein YAE1 n=1 Tax=Eremothecium cymbalariae (strain CBS 270.75 / DBVPG 7215 / KCTC 17166 / NRRL Y-17582) TaxID=931890 RepID=G8JR85_ERECY|nr:Hypothetical protein Ecym_3151 [Eremothecium cymbalariae DBVPG\